jgi:Domain of unknown function (DUF1848)
MPPVQIVLSASRRTDIPAFYMPWFMQGIERGEFEVVNPYNRRRTRVPATPSDVHTIVFWSKDFSPFLKGNHGRRLREKGYNLFFQFTLNPEDRILEPNVPGLADRLDQLRRLCDRFGPRAVNWRLDPICCYRRKGRGVRDNLQDLDRIAEAAASAGIRRCTTSFMDHYAKIDRRTAQVPDFAFVDLPAQQKRQMLLDLERQLGTRKLQLFTCCENALLEELPAESTIRAGACIPSDLLMDLYGGRLSLERDRGQRVQAGCGCRVSVDVGSYHLHTCRHGCLYCYARTEHKKPALEGHRISL